MASFFDQAATEDPSPEWYNKVLISLQGLTTSGSTADRPTAALWVGRPYFDTTLGIPVWYNGSGWVDATGASV